MAFDVVTSCSCVRLHDISDSSSSNRTPRIVALIPQKSLGRALTVAGFLFIAALTLSPQYGTVKAPPSFCVLCGGSSVLDAILNVLLFIPLGVGLRLSGMSRRRAFAIGLVTTITVELLQLWIPGRDTSSVAGGLIDHRLWVSAEINGVRRERTLPVDAGLGWSYLLPFDYEYGAEAPWLTAMWLAALAAPGAYWAVRAGARVLLAVAAVMAAGLLAIPWLASVHATPWWEWLALVAGLLAGAGIGTATVRASRPH
jgi:hypothetical protein